MLLIPIDRSINRLRKWTSRSRRLYEFGLSRQQNQVASAHVITWWYSTVSTTQMQVCQANCYDRLFDREAQIKQHLAFAWSVHPSGRSKIHWKQRPTIANEIMTCHIEPLSTGARVDTESIEFGQELKWCCTATYIRTSISIHNTLLDAIKQWNIMHKDYSSLSCNDSLSLSYRDEPELGSMVVSSSSCNDCNESVNKIPSKKQSTIGLITGETILEWGRRMVDEPVVNGLSIVFLFDDCRYWRMNAWSVHVSHQLGWKSHEALILCCGIGSRLFDPGFPKRCDPESDAYLMNRDVFGGGWVDISDILTSIEMSDEYKVNE